MNKIKETSLSHDASQLVSLLSGHAQNLATFTNTEWESLIEFAAKNDVSQMLYTALKAQHIKPPTIIDERIRNIHLASIVQNSKRFYDLAQILNAFELAAIKVVPVKGAWLGEAIYGNIALRGMSDIDLWVNRAEIDSAKTAMESLGYYSSSARTDRPRELLEELIGEIQFFKLGSAMVELHWTIYPGEWLRHASRIDEKFIWQRTLDYRGNYARQLAAEDAIIHIAIHLAVNHQMSMSGLRTLLDLDAVRHKLTVDWETVALRAKDWRVATAMWIVLSMLAHIFGDPDNKLPLQELRPSPLRRWVLEKFVTPQGLCDGLVIREGPIRFIFLLTLVDKPLDALRLVWRTFFPDRRWFTLRYGLQNAPQWRVLQNRLCHPIRVAWRKEI